MSSISTTNEDSIEIESPSQPNSTNENISKPVGVARINIINAKNLNSWFDGNNLDSFVKITCSTSGIEYCKTCVRKETNPEWNQVFYIPVFDINKKFKIHVYIKNTFSKNKSLGFYILDPKDLIKGKKLDLERNLIKSKNRILHMPPRLNKGKLRFIASFYSFSKYEPTTKTKFSKITTTFYKLYNLITTQCKDGSFKLTNELANLFNFNSKDKLIEEFTASINEAKSTKSLRDDILGTILITALFKTLLSLWNNEKNYVPYTNHVVWKKHYDKANDYLREIVTDITDIDIEVIYGLAQTFVEKYFKINEEEVWASWVGKGIQSATKDVSQSTPTTKFEATKKFLENILEDTIVNFTNKFFALGILQQKTYEDANKVDSSSQKCEVSIITTKKESVDETQNNKKAQNRIGTKQLKKKRIALTAAQSKTTVETTKKIVSAQKSDGTFELNEETSETKVQKRINTITTPKLLGSTEKMKEKVPIKLITMKYIFLTDTVSAILINFQSNTTPETAKKIVENQKDDGSIELNQTFTEHLDISSESSIQAFSYGTISKTAWETALSLYYLMITSQFHNQTDQYKEQCEKAKKYLIKEFKDEISVNEALKTSEKVIIEKIVQKERNDTAAIVITSTTTEKAKEIISCQNEDGSLQLTDTVFKELYVEFNDDSLISSIKTCLGKELAENKKLLDTVIILSFLRKTTPIDTSPELKEKYEKAEKYLKVQLGSDEKIKELWGKTDWFIINHATIKVVKEKVEQVLIKKVQESVTEEEYIKVIKNQNEDGSFDTSKQISDDLGITTSENISSIIRITDERVKKLDTKVLITFLTLAYCNKVLCEYQPKFKAQEEKARSWLHNQVKDEKLEKELIEICEKIIVEKVCDKKRKEFDCLITKIV